MKSRRGAAAMIPAHPQQTQSFMELWQVIGGRRSEATLPVNEHTKPVIEGFLRFLDHKIRKHGATPKGRRKLLDSSMNISSTLTQLEQPSAADTRRTVRTSPEAGS